MSRGFTGLPAENPNNCTDPYAPSFWLGKPGALTQIRMPDAGIGRTGVDNFAVHNLLDGQSVDRSPYLCRTWTFTHQWLTPDVMSVFMEYATRQRGIGPFILIDPQMKNLLSPNQASGTDALHTSEGFAVTGTAGLSSSTLSPVQGERSLRWDSLSLSQIYDTFTRVVAAGSLGTSDSGQTYSLVGAASDFSVTGALGRIATTSIGSLYLATIETGSTDHMMSVLETLPVLPTGAAFTLRAAARFTDSSNFYNASLTIAPTTGAATLSLTKSVLGSGTVIFNPVAVGTHAAGNQWTIIFEVSGSTVRARAWNVSNSSDPGYWQASVIDTALTTGTRAGFGVRRETSNSNGTTNVDFDNFTITSPLGGGPLKLVPPSGLYGWCLPPSKVFAFSGYVTGAASNTGVTVTPQVVLMNGTGSVQSTISGSAITPVTGAAQSFCITGSVPVGTGGVYVQPQFSLAGSLTSPVIASTLIDKLQFELIDGTVCTTWEYGQGQPLVGVRAENESIPRILRTDMTYVAVEVT